MHAATYSTFGPANEVLRLERIASPEPASNEVVVDIQFSGVNPSDVKSRAGRPGLNKPAFDKIIPHSDGSGIITAVGPDVSPERVGERVWIWNGQWQRPFGTAASQIVLNHTQAIALPDGVSFETGAVLGIPGLTAGQAVFGSGDVTGQTLLIQGGGGTVGHLAVQLAKWGGANVIATCSPNDFESCLAAGADHVFDYSDPELSTKILAANKGVLVDRIVEVEFGLNIDTDVALIKPNGTIAVYGSAKSMTPNISFFDMLFKAVTLDIILIYLLPWPERLEIIQRLNSALTANKLSCPVAEVFPLSQIDKAHALVETGGRHGAVLIDVRA